MAQAPKPQTVAIAASDQEFSKNAADGARANAKAAGLKIVYDKSYPPTTTDFAPIVRAVQATDPDLFFIASYPPDSVGMLRSMSEIGFKPKMLGGAMVGLNNVSIKMQLGPLLNGVVGYENWLPAPTPAFSRASWRCWRSTRPRRQARRYDPARLQHGDRSLCLCPGYCAGRRRAPSSLDQDKIADWLHSHQLHTVLGPFEYGPDGEWKESRFLTVQYRNITGKTLDQFKDPAKVVIIDPPAYKSGDLVYPYAEAVK